jgi:ubiquinone/menaquinone biosynthesis C-methylase UbiE
METPRPYPARTSYDPYDVAVGYEQVRFSSLVGRYRLSRERRAVAGLLREIPRDVTILDCPCGNGRWWNLLYRKASRVIAVDISDGMLAYAKERADREGRNVEIVKGIAEELPFESGSVDFTFSYALTKHLPLCYQQQALSEFARVARDGVICSFSVLSHTTYEIWRRRSLGDSYPVLPEQLAWMAEAAKLTIVASRKCTTPIGVEHLVLFRK